MTCNTNNSLDTTVGDDVVELFFSVIVLLSVYARTANNTNGNKADTTEIAVTDSI